MIPRTFDLAHKICFFPKTNSQLMVNCQVVGLGPGGLDSWNPLMKGIVTWVYPQNPKPATQTNN